MNRKSRYDFKEFCLLMSRKGSTMDNEEGLREAFATFDKASIYF